MSDKKLIKMLKWSLLGPFIVLLLFFSFDGMQVFSPTDTLETKIVSIAGLGFVSYLICLILIGLFCYSKSERMLDHALSERSAVDVESTQLLGAIQQQLHPVDEGLDYSVVDSQDILRTEIKKARRSGASNIEIAEYLQRELDDWIEGTRFVPSDFEAYTQIIDELGNEK